MGYPRGLIRYTSENQLARGFGRRMLWRRAVRPRSIAYALLLVAIVAGATVALALKSPLKVDVMRDRGALAREAAPDLIENVYRLQLMNTEEAPRQVRIDASGLTGLRVVGLEQPIALEAGATRLVPLRLQAPQQSAVPGSHPIEIVVTDHADARIERREKSTFILPR
jgi:polyferredoxin